MNKHTPLLKSKLNEKGTALIASYMVLTVLLTLTAGFVFSNVNELNQAQRYKNETEAFWIAEAGLQKFMQDTTLLNGGNYSSAFGNGTLSITKDDSDALERIVTSTGTVGGVSKQLQVSFPAEAPEVFSNTISSGLNLYYYSAALAGGIDVNGKTRLAGNYTKGCFKIFGISFCGSADFEDKVTGVASNTVSFTYPDSDSNGTADEFNDFKEFYQDLLSTYDPSEVIYLQQDSTATVYPLTDLDGVKIVYVEGTSAGAGDINILFSPFLPWNDKHDVTFISTGSVNYLTALNVFSGDFNLNTISWDDYNETSLLWNKHQGINYAHDKVSFTPIVLGTSTSSGSTVGNAGVDISLIGAGWKIFNYASALDENEQVPPGFEGLISAGSSSYSDVATNWTEI